VDWRMEAVCGQSDPELWFPDGYTTDRDLAQGALAKAICNQECPVRLKCLMSILEQEGMSGPGARHGIVGGADPDTRYRIARRTAARLRKARVRLAQQELAATDVAEAA